jgi:hypothetical protein
VNTFECCSKPRVGKALKIKPKSKTGPEEILRPRRSVRLLYSRRAKCGRRHLLASVTKQPSGFPKLNDYVFRASLIEGQHNCWDCGFEFRRKHGCLSLISVVLSGRGLCDALISHPEQSYRMWCV